MTTLLVPIDFSDNSLTAAQYALGLSAHLNINRVVLYHSSTDEKKTDDDLSAKALESVKEGLDNSSNVEILCVVNSDPLA